MTPFERAQKYVEKCPPGISGDDGHTATFNVAVALVHGFALPDHEAYTLMQQFNGTCSPPWTERELRHKLTSAVTTPHAKARGHLLGGKGVKHVYGGNAHDSTPHVSRPATTFSPKPEKPAAIYNLKAESTLPEPMADACRQFIAAAFEPGEGIAIAQEVLNDEQKGVPKDRGVVLSREEWIKKLEQRDGDPNKIFSTSDRTGAFIRVNPLKLGGALDSDVTSFRHALLEFDKISIQEQWNLITQSKIPCTAVIHSGNKSLHAWVKIDAKDRNEYNDRVSMLFDHFDPYIERDEQGKYSDRVKANRNPSRFSRLPGMVRGQKRQELIALHVGHPSFGDWMVQSQAESLPPSKGFREFMAMDTSNDPNCVIGFREGKTTRFLCKGKSAWLIGPSGQGKSSIITEFAIGWALGKPVFGITPARPLKSLIIQAENDDMDIAEMVQGIAASHKLNEFDGEDICEVVHQNVRFRSETTSIRKRFVDRLHRFIDDDKPDIVWLDPLLSFAGIDVTKQDQCSEFLREWLNPVLDATGVVMIGAHHTGKPKTQKETKNWSDIDYAYSGLGSSELVNWARAVMVLKPLDVGTYSLKLAKRGGRAGASHPDGTFTTSVWLQHAKTGIRWEQVEPSAPEENKKSGVEQRGGRENMVGKVAAMNLHDFLSKCTEEGEGKNEISRRLESWLATQKIDLSESACKRIIPVLVENQKLQKDENSKYKKGKNA